MNNISPNIGKWYKEIQQGLIFEVVAYDEMEQTVETQLIDGAVGEYDMESWSELNLEQVEEPEDWRSAYELSQEDSLDTDLAIHPEDWNNPINTIESDIVNGLIDDMEM
jgi:hypothetical protein